MNIDNPYNSILEKIITIDQLHQSTEKLREASNSLYKHGSNTKEILESILPYFIAEILFDLAQKNNIPLTDVEKLQKIIEDLQTYLENLPVVELVIAFIPSYRNIQKLSKWWEEYTGTHVILAIQVDESIIAGAKISYAGYYKDYSLANWLNQNATTSLDQFL